MKRTPLKSRSSKRARREAAWLKVREEVFALDRGRCVATCVPGCSGRSEHCHHLLRRSQGGADVPENLVSLCWACHEFIHANPAWAYEHGWLLRSA